jgi:hypothetical protein
MQVRIGEVSGGISISGRRSRGVHGWYVSNGKNVRLLSMWRTLYLSSASILIVEWEAVVFGLETKKGRSKPLHLQPRERRSNAVDG